MINILKKYTDFTRKTSIYPKDKALDYLILGLVNESGEVAGKYKKLIRGDYDQEIFTNKVIAELGDCFWYLIRLCDELEITPEEIIEMNIYKLQKRLDQNKIKGDGDFR